MNDLDSRSTKRRRTSTCGNSHEAFSVGQSNLKSSPSNVDTIGVKADAKDCLYSVESLLSVPLEVIFREIGDGDTQSIQAPNPALRKPWLTRAEAHCLLRISMLAHELDVLVELAEDELAQRQWRRSFRSKLLHTAEPRVGEGGGEEGKESKKKVLVHPFLRPIIPILDIQDKFSSHGCLQYVQVQLDRVVLGLRMCAGTLRNSCEQNYTYADNLDALDDGLSSPGRILAQEKRKLAELEEELCRRVEKILQDNSIASSNTISFDDAGSAGVNGEQCRNLEELDVESMNAVCAKVLGLPSAPWASQLDIPQQQDIPTSDNDHASPTKTDRPESDTAISASQNSYVQKSDAAEVLAVLAMGSRN